MHCPSQYTQVFTIYSSVGEISLFSEKRESVEGQERADAASPHHNPWKAESVGDRVREIPIRVGDQTLDLAVSALRQQPIQTLAERFDAVDVDDFDDSDGVGGGILGFRQAVGDGVEGEVGVFGRIGGIVAGVNDGDEESSGMEDVG